MTQTEVKKNYAGPLAVLTTLFFMWGFITCMNDILIPYLKGVFDLNHTQAMFVQFAFFGAYFVGSLLYFLISARSGDPIGRVGYKNGIILGLLLMSFVASAVTLAIAVAVAVFGIGSGVAFYKIT